jgi:hypothetical protein
MMRLHHEPEGRLELWMGVHAGVRSCTIPSEGSGDPDLEHACRLMGEHGAGCDDNVVVDVCPYPFYKKMQNAMMNWDEGAQSEHV